jgi:uncharacterized FlgJ-related protein
LGRFALALAAAIVVLGVCGAFHRTAPIIKPIDDWEWSYQGRPVQKVEFVALADLAPLKSELNYTEETWSSGQQDVPRLVLQQVPVRFAEVTVHEVPVEHKKRLFFQMVLPLVLIANEEMEFEREAFLGLKARIGDARIPGAGDLMELRRFAAKYDVPMDGDVVPVEQVLQTLERRIDIVPPSLALAQAAIESAWGTSRFALEGNALFGQWTFGPKGMVPEEQRVEKGDYRVAAFRTPLHSVRSYLRNLNTHPAYREFRKHRASARSEGKPLSGKALSATLTRYSERGAAYVKEIRHLIAVNGLSALDRSKLADGTVYELVPVWRAAG